MIIRLLCAILVVCLALFLSAPAAAADRPVLVAGTGLSSQADAAAGGAEAARKAQSQLKGQTPSLVLVYDNYPDRDKQRLLDAVAGVFPAELIHGCSAYAPITQEGNEGKVGVLALAGVQVTAAMAGAAGGHEACGRQIGQVLSDVTVPADKGKLLILFGNCHIYTNRELVKGVQSELGATFPIVGGAAEGSRPVYFKGQVQKNSNVGLLLVGDFAIRTSFQGNKGEGAEVAISTAATAAREAVGDAKDRTLLVLAFDCGGRRGWLGNQVARELEAMKASTGDLPLFGWYGSGEMGIGPDGRTTGEGYHLSMCAIMRPQ
jgi:hypothetical protein